MGRSIDIILGQLLDPAILFEYLETIGLPYGYYNDKNKLWFHIVIDPPESGSHHLLSLQYYRDLIEKTEDKMKRDKYIQEQSKAMVQYKILTAKLGTQPTIYLAVPIYYIDKFEKDPEAQLQRMFPLIETIGKISTRWPCVIHNEGGEIYTHADIVRLHEQKIDFVYSTVRM